MKLFRKKEVVKYQRQCDIIGVISLISGSIAVGLSIYSAIYNSNNLSEIRKIINDTDGDAGLFYNIVDDAVLTMGRKKEEEYDEQLFSETLIDLNREVNRLTEITSELVKIPMDLDETEFHKYQNKIINFSEKCNNLTNFCKNELLSQTLSRDEKIRDALMIFNGNEEEN